MPTSKKRPTGAPKSTATRRPAAKPDADAFVDSLRRLSSKKIRDEMGPRYGNHTDRALGVAMSKMKAVAKQTGRSHDLAAALWKTGWYEARTVAAFVEDPARVTPAQMDRWAKDFDNWGICDTVCFHLFDKTPHAMAKVKRWAASREEFVKRAAFALLASLALHDKAMPDEPFEKCLPLIERAAGDDRNFVKKGVSWALRSVGRRSAALHKQSLALAERLASSEDAAPRWVGRDAVRDLSNPKVRAAAARKGKPKAGRRAR